MNKYYIWIIFLVLLNIFLLFRNYQKNTKINELEVLNSSFESSSILDKKEIFYKNKINDPVQLVVLIPENSCISCLLYDLDFINLFNSNYPKNLSVYHIENKKGHYPIRNLDTNFEYTFIDSAGVIFDTKKNLDLNIEKPTYLVIDQSRMIQTLHVSNIFKLKNTDKFFEQINSLFEIYQNNYNQE